jgi:hypothetical protein
MEKREIIEAKNWLRSAQELLDHGERKERFTVVVAQAIHSILKANDALTMRYLERRAMRHDQAILLFQDLIRQNKIPSEEARYSDILIRAIQEKSAYDYGGKWASKAKAEHWVRDARKFLSLAERYV